MLHPEILRYDPQNLSPALVAGQVDKIVTEVAEQIYTFDLFTLEFCTKLIAEAEHMRKWETKSETEKYGPIVDVAERDTTLSMKEFPGFNATYTQIVKLHLAPLVQALWKSFKVQKADQPYLLKYEPHVVREMNLHFDLETVSMVVALNDAFEGGGTYFPRWKFSTGKQKIGRGILYPGGVSHEHEGLAITQGVRYLFMGAFY